MTGIAQGVRMPPAVVPRRGVDWDQAVQTRATEIAACFSPPYADLGQLRMHEPGVCVTCDAYMALAARDAG